MKKKISDKGLDVGHYLLLVLLFAFTYINFTLAWMNRKAMVHLYENRLNIDYDTKYWNTLDFDKPNKRKFASYEKRKKYRSKSKSKAKRRRKAKRKKRKKKKK